MSWLPLVGSVTYTANAVHFDGATDLKLGSALTGVANAKVGTASFWLKIGGTDGTLQTLLSLGDGSASILELRRPTSNAIQIIGKNVADATILSVSSNTATFVAASAWQNVLVSWNLATATVQLYVNDSSDANVATATNDTLSYTTANGNYIGSEFSNFLAPLTGDAADLWIDTTAAMDFSVTANRRKFISAGLTPVSLGSDGSAPTGTSPILFQSGSTGSWQTNKGTGGGWTVENGSLTTASTHP